MLNKIKGYFDGGYSTGVKIAIFLVVFGILSVTFNTLTDSIGLTDYTGHKNATGLWRASGAPTMKALYDSYFDAFDVPETHDTVASISSYLSIILSIIILIMINNRKKKQLIIDQKQDSQE